MWAQGEGWHTGTHRCGSWITLHVCVCKLLGNCETALGKQTITRQPDKSYCKVSSESQKPRRSLQFYSGSEKPSWQSCCGPWMLRSLQSSQKGQVEEGLGSPLPNTGGEWG